MSSLSPEQIKQHFGAIWPKHVSSLTRFLIQCRAHFDGDLDLFLILAIIGDRSFAAHKVPDDMKYEALLDPNRVPLEPEALNVLSIAHFSGIPRETVRRKVNDLVDKGWVERDELGNVKVTRKAAFDLHPLTETSFEYLASMAKVLSAR